MKRNKTRVLSSEFERMSQQKNFVVKGLPIEPIPDCSLSEYLVPKLRALPQDQIIQVFADTGEEQTVGEFLEKSIKLSEGLKKLGLKKNDVVVMLCRNSFEADEIVLGTWLSGAVIAPFCSTAMVYEIKHFLELTRPQYIFCEEEAADNVTAALDLLSMPCSCRVILVPKTESSQCSHMTFCEVLVDVDVKNYQPQPTESPATELVGILSSSGTSGLPKGVGLTHKNLIFQDLNMKDILFMNSKLDCLQISNFFWMTGVLMFLRSLTTGLKRVLLWSPTELNVLSAIDRYKTGWTLMAPLFALSIANHPDFEKFEVSSTKIIAVGGSPLTPKMGEKILGKWKGVKIIQSYGTTEVSGCICATGEEEINYSVGKVTNGVQIKIVDPTGKSLPSHNAGEIWVKSPGIMKGYIRNEEATREAVDPEGWFHTGDLGYYDDEEQVYLIDRIKEMIKVMNMQIAPAEIENVILSIPGILEAGVVGVTEDGNIFQPAALVVKKRNSKVTEEDIHAQVAGSLADYKKLSGGVYFVESLPKTASGKLGRKELRNVAQALYSKACN